MNFLFTFFTNFEALEAIADYFNISMGALTGKEYGKNGKQLSDKQQALLEVIEQLTDEQCEAVLKLLGK